MKRFLWVLVSVMMLSLTAVSASAVQYVYDNGNILTDWEEAHLEALAESEGAKHGISIVILTEDGIAGADPMMYAADFYDIIGSDELDYIGDYAVSHFSDGDYAEGFEQYILITSELTEEYLYGTPTEDEMWDDHYSDEYYYEDEYSSAETEVGSSYYVVAVGISLLIAFLVCSGFKKQLNSAVKKTGASDYFQRENADVTLCTDRFLYSRTRKVRKSSDNNSGGRSGGSRSGGSRSFSGSSGRSHSGGGGKF